MIRIITDAPWYVSNLILHKDLGMNTIKEEIRHCSRNYNGLISIQTLAAELVREKITRGLKRKIPQDLIL